MRFRWALMLVIGATAAGDPATRPVELRSAVPCTGTVRFEPACNGPDCLEPVVVDFQAPGFLTPPAAAAKAIVSQGTCWAPPFQTGDASPSYLTLVPLTNVTGTLGADRSLPAMVSVSIRVSAGDPWLSGPGVCRLRSKAWSCAIPSSARDIRVEIPGFSAAYYWETDLRSSEGTLKPRVVASGASIIGTLTGPRRFPLENIEVTAREVKTGTSYRAKSDERGFFQLVGLRPGEYSLATAAKQLSSLPIALSVLQEKEYPLDAPIDLRERGSIQVVVTPVPIGMASWTVRVQRPDPSGEVLSTVASGALDESGAWVAEGLEPGPRVIEVLDESGQILHRQNVEITWDRLLVPVPLTLIPVRGRVSLGSEPLQAAVQFFRAGSRLTFESDDGGQFAGMLPEEGKWQVQVSPANGRQRIRTGAVEIRRSTTQAWAQADITLPAGRIRGVVVNRLGKPVPDAQVIVMRGDALSANAGIEADGSFQLFGLEEGDVVLTALAGEQRSAPLSYHVSEHPDEVSLLLEESVEVRGRVITEDGRPVPGALVRHVAGMDGVRESTSGPSGEFKIQGPTGSLIHLAILVPGFPVKLHRFVADRDVTPVIRLSSVPAFLVVRLHGAPPWPYVVANHAAMPLPALFRPRMAGQPPVEASAEGFVMEVDPDQYSLCSSATAERCIAGSLPPAARITMDASTLWPAKPRE